MHIETINGMHYWSAIQCHINLMRVGDHLSIVAPMEDLATILNNLTVSNRATCEFHRGVAHAHGVVYSTIIITKVTKTEQVWTVEKNYIPVADILKYSARLGVVLMLPTFTRSTMVQLRSVSASEHLTYVVTKGYEINLETMKVHSIAVAVPYHSIKKD